MENRRVFFRGSIGEVSFRPPKFRVEPEAMMVNSKFRSSVHLLLRIFLGEAVV